MASEPQDAHLSASQTSGAELDNETLSPLEQEVLDEYARLLGNLNNVRIPTHTHASLVAPLTLYEQMSTLLLDLSNKPSAAILDGLRGLERKTSLVFTLLKASVYSIVLNQQIGEDGDEGDRGSVEGR
jgi:DASH complex subunit DAD3